MNSGQISKILIKKASEVEGLRIWRNNVGRVPVRGGRVYSFGLPTGSADYIGFFWGVFVALEVKGEGDKLSDEQEKFMKVCEQYGCITSVIDSDNVEEFDKWIRKQRKQRGN